MDNNEDFYIYNDVLYKQRQIYKNTYENIPVISKEAFIECYKKWILEESEE